MKEEIFPFSIVEFVNIMSSNKKDTTNKISNGINRMAIEDPNSFENEEGIIL